jgi:hypothetical protein
MPSVAEGTNARFPHGDQSHRSRSRLAVLSAPALVGIATTLIAPTAAHADSVAYLVNVTVRPGYGFPTADAALAYGNDLCNKVRSGEPYGSIMTEVKRDLDTSDEYQASYLITQAANELCPAAIWQLRSSAIGYRPGSE